MYELETIFSSLMWAISLFLFTPLVVFSCVKGFWYIVIFFFILLKTVVQEYLKFSYFYYKYSGVFMGFSNFFNLILHYSGTTIHVTWILYILFFFLWQGLSPYSRLAWNSQCSQDKGTNNDKYSSISILCVGITAMCHHTRLLRPLIWSRV